MFGSLATFGYASKMLDVKQELHYALRVNKEALIIDTRLIPWCGWSEFWRRNELHERYGKRYIWRGDWLGNLNHDEPDLSIQLADEQHGLPWLVRGLEKGFTLILLCGCPHEQKCHRKVIHDKVKAVLSDQLKEYRQGQRVMTPCGAGVIDPFIPLQVQRARNRYAVLLDVPCTQRYFFPHEIEPYTFVQSTFIAEDKGEYAYAF